VCGRNLHTAPGIIIGCDVEGSGGDRVERREISRSVDEPHWRSPTPPKQSCARSLFLLFFSSQRPFCDCTVGLIPREDCASDHVLRALEPYTVANGGPLEIEVIKLSLNHPDLA
jgi:hypothetical protein